MLKNKKILHFLLPIVGLLLVNFIYFYPALQGKVLEQDDIKLGYAKGKEIRDYRETHDDEPLWTEAMFSGMPTFQISTEYPSNWIYYVQKTLGVIGGSSSGIYIVFILMFGFYLALIAMKTDPLIAAIGSIAFAFSAFFIISYGAGHNAKVRTAAYMAPVVVGVLLAYRGKLLAGFSLTALFLGLSIFSNHFQITYYLAILIVIIGFVELIYSLLDKSFNKFLKATGVLAVAAVIAIGPNISNLWSTYEYTKETMRGGSSELKQKAESKGGLSFDYAMSWSYGKAETLNLIYPDFSGGGMAQNYEGTETHSELYPRYVSALQQRGAPKKTAEKQANQIISQMFYWGDQSLVNGGYYIGAIVFFLFVLAMFVVKGKVRAWVIAATIVSILMAWGKNSYHFNKFLFDYLPIYSKFRVPSMSFTVLFFVAPFFGFYGLGQLVKSKLSKKELSKYLKYTLYITGGLSLFIALFGSSMFDFVSQNDIRLKEQGLNLNSLYNDRASLMRMSAFKTLGMCVAAFAIVWAWVNEKVKPVLAISALAVAVLIDQWGFDKQHLNADDFQTERSYEAAFAPTPADQIILQDKDIHFRVFNTTAGLTSDSYTSYYHKSIGGYHGAKLIRYQDLIENQLAKSNMACFDMLNAKWFIVGNQQGQVTAQRNPGACGAAWLPYQIISAENANDEMSKLSDFAPKTQVVVDKRYSSYVDDLPKNITDSTSTIGIIQYDPKHMVYEANITSNNRLAVFSEIYYEGGNNDWKAFIDGEPVDHIRVNYLLRGLKIPNGKHKIEFVFHPRSYYTGEKISLVFSILLFGSLGFGLFTFYKKQKEGSTEE